MTSKEIRSAFFQFFQDKNHQLVDSAPIVVKDDPTLMFTNAGMNQFKELFLGNEAIKYKRIVDTQKCLRVSGKHNDLEEVGVDTYHHTMFEMMGNWSFGDFFKAEMIPWAWEFLTEILKIDKDRLYVTVFEGDAADGLGEDKMAYDCWAKIIDTNRIIKAGKKDNFWEMGEMGPCGPSSEIHVDIRSEADRRKIDGRDLVNADHPLVVEIWNLVFIEFNRKKDKSLSSLPAKHVDTGMGLERLCMILQDKKSNYDTDLFQPLIGVVENISEQKYKGSEHKQDIAFRVIVDHIRAIAFAIADGQLPANNGSGYVIRRILRRAVRYGYSFLDLKQPFMHRLLSPLIDSLGETFNELKAQKSVIEKVILEEEQSFLNTLEKGIGLFENHAEKVKREIDGAFAFELYDTYGFPIDLTCLLAEEKGLSVDRQAFEAALKKQKERSRAATKIDTDDWVILKEDDREEFVGYEQTTANVQLTRYRKIVQKNKELYQLVFNLTPFYPESGGQVGDTGYIEQGGHKTFIIDTKKENNLIVHFCKDLPLTLDGDFTAVVNAEKRRQTAVNHSATHLLHLALRKILGNHIEQKGSLVHPDYLRFDFSHFQKLSTEELTQIEDFVNAEIRKNIPLQERRNVPLEEAKDSGAMALFGEKYGDTVRMIQFDSSIELCGGTHVQATGEIGFFAIYSESAIASGVRRIEAYGGTAAVDLFKNQREKIRLISERLKHPKDLVKAFDGLQEEKQKLQKEVEELKAKAAQEVKNKLLSKVERQGEVNVLIDAVALDAASIKNIAFQLRAEVENLFLVLASKDTKKPTLSVLISENLVKEKKWNAAEIVKNLAKYIQGGGGGQAFFATAGGKKASGISEALETARQMLS